VGDAVEDIRVLLEEERDVRQGARGDEHDRVGRGADPAGHRVRGELVDRDGRGRRQLGALDPRLPVDVGRGVERAVEGMGRAGRDLDVGPAGEGEDAERRVGRRLEHGVAADRADAEDAEVRSGEREEDRDRVVVARIAVDDDREGAIGRCPRRLRRRVGRVAADEDDAGTGRRGAAHRGASGVGAAPMSRRTSRRRTGVGGVPCASSRSRYGR
jgi:hypothetical protein